MSQSLVTPKEAAAALNISTMTISRCVKLGAPVHRWGTTGRRYRIDLAEFTAWMESQDGKPKQKASDPASFDIETLARRRKAALRAL